MKKTLGWALLIAVAGVGAILFQQFVDRPPPAPPAPIEAPVATPAPPEPALRYPIAGEAAPGALPPLHASDAVLAEALARLWGERLVEQLFNLDGFVRRVVATVDNLPRREGAMRLTPVKPAPGRLLTTGSRDNLMIAPANAARYATHIRVVNAIDSSKLVSLYVRYYPLFQQAYEELGYPNAYFNDRLMEVIDHMLAAPERPQGAKLVQPKVLYKYADDELEERSTGQKIMMRIGSENAAALKAKLREIRAELIARSVRP